MQFHSAEQYYRDMIDLCGKTIKWVNWHYTASIIVDKGEHFVDSVDAIDIERDFVKGFSDNITITVRVLKQFYMNKIYPNRDNLYINLKQTQTPENESGFVLLTKETHVQKYRAFLIAPIDMSNNTTENSTPMGTTDINANNLYITIKIQLLLPVVELLSKIAFGGLFHGVPGELTRAMLTECINQMKDYDVERLQGVSMTPYDNTKSHYDIAIPHGTKAIHLPRLIQSTWYGIYHHGIGSYITKEFWYLYPLYDYTRYEREKLRLTISVLPKIMMSSSRRTYHINKQEVSIICNGDTKAIDSTQSKVQNGGTGVTWVDSSKIKQNTVITNNDGVYLQGNIATKTINANYDGQYQSNQYQKETIHSSESLARSELAERGTAYINLIWEHAHPTLLVPGMPVKIIYYVGNLRYHVHGTLVKVNGLISREGNMSKERHSTVASLVIAMNPNEVKTVEQKQFGSKSTGVSGGLFHNTKSWF